MKPCIEITRKAGEIATVLAALEQHLTELDRLGMHIASAHLDAAVQQLRIHQTNRKSADA